MTAALEVDVTGWMITQLQAALGSLARVGSKTPGDPGDTSGWLPFVRVVRAGGPDDGVILDIPTVVLHCFAADLAAANTLAMSTLTAVRGLRGRPADGAVVTHVRKLGGPFWVDDANPSVEHVAVTVQLHIRTTAR